MNKEKEKIALFFVNEIVDTSKDVIMDAFKTKPETFPIFNSVIDFVYSVKKDYDLLSLNDIAEESFNELTTELLSYVIL